MKKSLFLIGLILTFVFVNTLLAQTGSQPNVKMQMDAKKLIVVEKIVDGKKVKSESFEPAKEVFPGDIVQYDLTYWNEGTDSARDLKILGPIPQNTFYLADTATPLPNAEIKYSINGGKTFALPPIKYKVKEKDEKGIEKEVERIATPDMYTHIQWNLKKPFAPKEKLTVSYRVKVK